MDVIGALVTYLEADATVTAACARIWGGDLALSENDDMPRKNIVLKAAGGPGGLAYQEYRYRRVDVDCYGATLREAEQLFDVVSEELKQLRRNVTSNVLIHSVDISADATSGHDPDTDWPMCVGSFVVLAADAA